MSTLGDILKAEREKRDLSLHEIGLSLKINPKILQALEDGQKENLPAKTFLRGFVRSYAQYLRLNVDDALKLFHDEYGIVRSENLVPIPGDANGGMQAIPTQVHEPLRTPSSQEEPRNRDQSRIFFIAGGIFLFVLVVFVAKMVDKYQKERATRPLPLPTAESITGTPSPSASPVADETPSPEAAAAMGATPTPSPVALMSAAATTSTSTATTTPSPTATLSPANATPSPSPVAAAAVKSSLTPTPAPTATVTPTPAADAGAKPSPSPSASESPAPKPTEVIIETLNTVTVKYTFSDGKTQTLNLAASKLHTLRSKGPVNLEISDGGALNLIVNGRDRGVPGQIGQPLKLTLP